MGKLSVSAEEQIAEMKEQQEKDYAAVQFKHYYNLFSIYGQSKIDAFKKELRSEGLSESYIQDSERRGCLMSNWMKDKYLKENIVREGKIPFEMKRNGR